MWCVTEKGETKETGDMESKRLCEADYCGL